jgi:hypothetical protein
MLQRTFYQALQVALGYATTQVLQILRQSGATTHRRQILAKQEENAPERFATHRTNTELTHERE